jgi:hypothetical protein
MATPDLEHRFTYHPPKDGQAETYQGMRAVALNFARTIDQQVPDSREKALALTHLEQAVMWANAGIARNG